MCDIIELKKTITTDIDFNGKSIDIDIIDKSIVITIDYTNNDHNSLHLLFKNYARFYDDPIKLFRKHQLGMCDFSSSNEIKSIHKKPEQLVDLLNETCIDNVFIFEKYAYSANIIKNINKHCASLLKDNFTNMKINFIDGREQNKIYYGIVDIKKNELDGSGFYKWLFSGKNIYNIKYYQQHIKTWEPSYLPVIPNNNIVEMFNRIVRNHLDHIDFFKELAKYKIELDIKVHDKENFKSNITSVNIEYDTLEDITRLELIDQVLKLQKIDK